MTDGRVLALALAVCLAACGCVQRRLTIRSNPPGAVVYVDDFQVGTTPVSTDFIYYGTREIRLVKSGYETLTVLQPIPAPWYQWPGIDFVSENLIPGEIRDERVVDFQMQPQLIKPTQQLLDGAEGLRRSMPAPATALPPVGPIVPGPTGQPFVPPPGALPYPAQPGAMPYGAPPAGQVPMQPPAGQPYSMPPGFTAPPPGGTYPVPAPGGVYGAPPAGAYGVPPAGTYGIPGPSVQAVPGPGFLPTSPAPQPVPGPPVSPPPVTRPYHPFNY